MKMTKEEAAIELKLLLKTNIKYHMNEYFSEKAKFLAASLEQKKTKFSIISLEENIENYQVTRSNLQSTIATRANRITEIIKKVRLHKEYIRKYNQIADNFEIKLWLEK